MVARELLKELASRGVRLEVDGERLVAHGPPGAVPPELASQIKAHKDALFRELQDMPNQHESPPTLPEPLVRLVRAATVNALNYSAPLPTGRVSDLGTYVLACAALYAAGVERERQLHDLWAARAAWNA